uniref:Uncharacterized protein n=1 Tax=Eutreptiella gymnastica TaxID=73025 RepID=A0A7S1NME0_9EUGL|mmetsp:Transcript_58162/g.103784  ORF Transcript_58162/g.103784 Transcript_58162/m.103784 type:complete len:381 (+) Transcript_58162:116-1258(+)
MDDVLLNDEGSPLGMQGNQAPTFQDTLAELLDGLNTRTALETKFNKTLNAIKTGKLQVKPNMLLADGTIEFEEEPQSPHEVKKKKGGRKMPGLSGKTQSQNAGANRGFSAAAHAVQATKMVTNSAGDQGERTTLPPVAKSKSSSRIVSGTLGDYIGLTTSDFETLQERERREKQERFRALKAKLDESQAASEDRATRFRGQLSATIEGPCYGHKTMFQKLQALKEDPSIYAELKAAVRSYKEENRARRNLKNANGRDPFKANKELLHHLPRIKDEQRGLVSKSRQEHQQQVLARRQRVRNRKFLERFMMFEHSTQRHNVATQRLKGMQAKEKHSGTVPPPLEVLRAQGIAQWIIMTMAADWFVAAFAPVRQKKEAEKNKK